MVEYMLNVWREAAEVIVDELGVVTVKMPNGDIKTFVALEIAIDYLYKRGFMY